MIVIWQSWVVLNVCSKHRDGTWRAVRPGGFNMRAGGEVLVFSFLVSLLSPYHSHPEPLFTLVRHGLMTIDMVMMSLLSM